MEIIFLYQYTFYLCGVIINQTKKHMKTLSYFLFAFRVAVGFGSFAAGLLCPFFAANFTFALAVLSVVGICGGMAVVLIPRPEFENL